MTELALFARAKGRVGKNLAMRTEQLRLVVSAEDAHRGRALSRRNELPASAMSFRRQPVAARRRHGAARPFSGVSESRAKLKASKLLVVSLRRERAVARSLLRSWPTRG